MNKCIITLLILFLLLPLYSLDVGGHITHDTTWAPENNPYEVVNNIYVDSGVDLTILPGTIIKFHAAPATYEALCYDFDIDQQGESVAKLIFVNGRVIAEGTVQDSITFTRYEESPENMRWGNIVCYNNAPKSVFKHCKFLYPYLSSRLQSEEYLGCLTSRNGAIDVSYCRFFNHSVGIWIGNTTEPVLIHHNTFQLYERLFEAEYLTGIWSTSLNTGNEFIVAYNKYEGTGAPYDLLNGQVYPVTRLFERMKLHYNGNWKRGTNTRIAVAGDAFGNVVTDTNTSGVGTTTFGLDHKGYIKRNTVINSLGIGGYGYLDISDNYVENSEQIRLGDFASPARGDIYNNRLINSYILDYAEGEIYNNVITGEYNNPIKVNNLVTAVRNNTVLNMNVPLDFSEQITHIIIENNIFWNALPFSLYPYPYTNFVFRNNCMSVPLPVQCIDGGGNIIGQYPMFADTLTTEDYNLHLLPGSPCIDAGYDTTGYQAMDFDYFRRVVDGNNDGITRIDIGAYEYGSAYPGGYSGHILFPDNTPVSLVRIDIEGVTREYTDSLGYFRFSAPAGTYTLYAHHIFEGDKVFTLTIAEGQTTEQDFIWQAEENEDENDGDNNPSGSSVTLIDLHVFPNPFSLLTTIAYTLKQTGKVKAVIYNIKGERVKTVTDTYQSKGYNSLIWNGEDEKGRLVANGIYYIRLSASNDNQYLLHKIVMMR